MDEGNRCKQRNITLGNGKKKAKVQALYDYTEKTNREVCTLLEPYFYSQWAVTTRVPKARFRHSEFRHSEFRHLEFRHYKWKCRISDCRNSGSFATEFRLANSSPYSNHNHNS